jgi:hypothetical protein
MLSSALLSRLTPHVDEINDDHRCGFRRNRSATDKIYCIGLGAFAASELDKVFSGYQPR